MRMLLLRLRSSPRLVARMLAASLAANLLGVAASLYVMLVLNRYVSHGVDATLAALTAGVVLAICFEHVFRRVRLRTAAHFGRADNERTATGVFGILLTARPSAEAQGDASKREAARAADTIDTVYGPANLAALFDLPFAAVFIVLVMLISWPLALICAFSILIATAAGILAQADMRTAGAELSQSAAEAQGLVNTAIQNRETVAAFAGARPLMAEWQRNQRALRALRERLSSSQGRAQALSQSLQALQGVFVIAVGAVLVVRGELDVGALIGANLLASKALAPFSRLAQIGESMAMARQARTKLEAFARTPVEPGGGATLMRYSGGLEFRDVGFAPQGAAAPLFSHVSFILPAGGVLALKGRNGSGKSAAARLIVGLAEPREGAVLADGVDIRTLQPDWWRRQVAYLPQEPTFLNMTIRDNLLAVNSRLSDQDIHALLKRTGADRAVAACAQGIDTKLRSHGMELAVGHRRRLALARALAGGGRLVVLDEPTDGLDAEGTAVIYRILIDLARSGHTVVIASHDPRILQGASLILDLDQMGRQPSRAAPEPSLSAS
ncbi:ATP-binding cassette domain-containing protein [Arenibaculum pallidiluteum]|uniref:ATP-binding cassette domain-containing protein n=1 Tax=Arenibaculum pallidiluteum TaxID=2812559 RepID=UPI001A9605A9|nr:ATP-binding cassette domain-containing protein [Arenibaculum pallidiluteum]